MSSLLCGGQRAWNSWPSGSPEQKDDEQLGREAEAEPDDEERCDRDLGHDLEEDHDRIDGLLDEAATWRRRAPWGCSRRLPGDSRRGSPGLSPRLPGEQCPSAPGTRSRSWMEAAGGTPSRRGARPRTPKPGKGRRRRQAGRRRAVWMLRAVRCRPALREGPCGQLPSRCPASPRSMVPNSAGRLISISSRSSDRPTTLCATPAGCEAAARPHGQACPRRRIGR